MVETDLSPIHNLPSGLCEDPGGEARALLRRLAKDDATALLELHLLWAPTLLGIACRMLGDPHHATKAVTETFVQIWQQAADFDRQHVPPFVWAFTILRSACITQLARRRRPPAPNSTATRPPLAADRRDNPRIMPADDFRRVRNAMDQLAPDERSCLEAAVFLQTPAADSAEYSDIAAGTVKNCLRQALKKVRNQLSRYEL